MLKILHQTIILVLSLTLLITFSFSATAKSDEGLSSSRPDKLKINRNKVKLQIPEKFRQGVFKKDRSLILPDGLKISLFATGLGKVRFMAVGPDGHIYATVPKNGKVLVLPDKNRDGVADEIFVFASRLDRPHGLAFRGKDLFVAETGRILKFTDNNADLKADKIKVISEDVPPGGGHWTRTLVIGDDDMLYLSAGSSCNICIEKDIRRAAILRYPLSGGKGELYAKGLRNSVGLAFHPKTKELWASNNGRDRLGDDLPPEELNRIIYGGDYGWPYCYGQKIPDPDFGNDKRCRSTIAPVVEMQAHSAPLGINFGFGLDFPDYLKNMLYIAFHGSWNRSKPTGYKLIGIPFKNGFPAGPPVDIVTGWLQGRKKWGRPVAPLVGSDGALYLSDDSAGAIYRINPVKKK